MGQALVGARLVWRRDSDIGDPIRYAATLVEAGASESVWISARARPLCALKGILFFLESITVRLEVQNLM